MTDPSRSIPLAPDPLDAEKDRPEAEQLAAERAEKGLAKEKGPVSEQTARATEYAFQVTYQTELFGPPHTVTIRSSTNDWRDMPMTPNEGDERTVWSGEIKTYSADPVALEYKLVLDGVRWQIGWNQRGVTATAPAGARFDDSNLAWED